MAGRQTRPRRRRISDRRCPSGKTAYTTHDAAEGARKRLNGPDDDCGRAYACRECGGWHVTRYSRAEQDRRRAELHAQPAA